MLPLTRLSRQDLKALADGGDQVAAEYLKWLEEMFKTPPQTYNPQYLPGGKIG